MNKIKPRSNASARLKSTAQKSKIRNLAIVTGGGDCPGLNAAIRAVVKRASQEKVHCWGVLEGFRGLYDGQIKRLEPIDVAGIISRGGTILGSSRFNPLKPKDGLQKIKKQLQEKNIDVLMNIGGEGTMRLSYELEKKGIPVIGIPKTIDNDVWGTDFTFGFDTAVSIATEAIDRLHTTAESHSRIMIVEVMGRHTGWIATYAGLAGGADAILIPEKPFRLSRLIEIIEWRQKVGKRFSIIVVSEDAKIILDQGNKKPSILEIPSHYDEYGKVQLGGIAIALEEELRKHINAEIRSTILGHVQRGGSPTAYDRVLATRLGVAAAELALQGKHARMVALQGKEIKAIALNKVVKKLKTVDLNLYELSKIFY